MVEVNGLSEIEVNAVSNSVITWVKLNHQKLTDFWFNGNTWFDDEVSAFKRSLIKLKSQ